MRTYSKEPWTADASAPPVPFEGPLLDFQTGTGFANAKLSEILPAARVARFVRMTSEFHTEETQKPLLTGYAVRVCACAR